MVDRATGNALAACALRNQDALGVSYVIWRQRINFGSGWQPMEDRGGVTANHFDHVHVSFESGGGGGRLARPAEPAPADTPAVAPAAHRLTLSDRFASPSAITRYCRVADQLWPAPQRITRSTPDPQPDAARVARSGKAGRVSVPLPRWPARAPATRRTRGRVPRCAGGPHPPLRRASPRRRPAADPAA